MPLAFSTSPPQIAGTKRVVRGTVTFDSSYPTGGEAFTPASLGLTGLEQMFVQPGTYVVNWNRSAASPLLLAYMGDNNNASDGPLIEVANTTDLSALVLQFEAIGY